VAVSINDSIIAVMLCNYVIMLNVVMLSGVSPFEHDCYKCCEYILPSNNIFWQCFEDFLNDIFSHFKSQLEELSALYTFPSYFLILVPMAGGANVIQLLVNNLRIFVIS
jgi:hypothetical protein